jgi:ribosomal protein L20
MYTGLRDICTDLCTGTATLKTTDGFMLVGCRTIIQSAAKCKLYRNKQRKTSAVEFRNTWLCFINTAV